MAIMKTYCDEELNQLNKPSKNDGNKLLIQPKRSKREDLCDKLLIECKKDYDNTEVDMIFTEEALKKHRMRCSEHCGDIVREVQ